MLVLSKYKDYYDHLAHIFGVDEKIVLDRRQNEQPKWNNWRGEKVILYICDHVIEGWRDKHGEFFWQGDLEHIGEWNDRQKCYRIEVPGKSHYWNYVDVYPEFCKAKQKLNTESGVAVLLAGEARNLPDRVICRYPKLSEMGINKIIPAQDIYLLLCEWLAPKDGESAPQTDKEKIVANGFDTKDSFRNTK